MRVEGLMMFERYGMHWCLEIVHRFGMELIHAGWSDAARSDQLGVVPFPRVTAIARTAHYHHSKHSQSLYHLVFFICLLPYQQRFSTLTRSTSEGNATPEGSDLRTNRALDFRGRCPQ
jgi:hypothetical protein